MTRQASLIKRIFVALGVLVVHTCLASMARAQGPGAWRDPSKHLVKFITVDEDVQLEVLYWGGSGRAIVLLWGSGNTAHVFHDFSTEADRLLPCLGRYLMRLRHVEPPPDWIRRSTPGR